MIFTSCSQLSHFPITIGIRLVYIYIYYIYYISKVFSPTVSLGVWAQIKFDAVSGAGSGLVPEVPMRLQVWGRSGAGFGLVPGASAWFQVPQRLDVVLLSLQLCIWGVLLHLLRTTHTRTHTHTCSETSYRITDVECIGRAKTTQLNLAGEMNIYIYIIGLRWPPAATYNCAQVHHRSPAGTFTRVPGRCLRWSPTPPGPRWPPVN